MLKKLSFILLLGIVLMRPATVWATEASLVCSPNSGTYCIGDTITSDLILNTRNFQIFGAKVAATFTTGVIEPVGTQVTPVTAVTNWTAPTANTIDGSVGTVLMDYGRTQAAFTGNTAIGQIRFTAKTAGQAQFIYTFFQQYDDTTPGVAITWGKKDEVNLSNVLTDVSNCLYVIEACSTPSPTPGPTSPAAPTAIPPTRPPITQLPQTGVVDMPIAVLGLSGIFIATGMILPFALLRKRS